MTHVKGTCNVWGRYETLEESLSIDLQYMMWRALEASRVPSIVQLGLDRWHRGLCQQVDVSDNLCGWKAVCLCDSVRMTACLQLHSPTGDLHVHSFFGLTVYLHVPPYFRLPAKVIRRGRQKQQCTRRIELQEIIHSQPSGPRTMNRLHPLS